MHGSGRRAQINHIANVPTRRERVQHCTIRHAAYNYYARRMLGYNYRVFVGIFDGGVFSVRARPVKAYIVPQRCTEIGGERCAQLMKTTSRRYRQIDI